MSREGKLVVPAQLRSGFVESSNTDEVAVCLGMGCNLVDGAECRREYGIENPYSSGKPKAVFSIEGASRTWQCRPKAGDNPVALPTAEIRRAYNSDGTPCEQLDDLIAQVDNAELRQQIENVLPLAIAAYGRAFMESRGKCLRMVYAAIDFVKGRTRNGQRYIATRNAREFARRIGAE